MAVYLKNNEIIDESSYIPSFDEFKEFNKILTESIDPDEGFGNMLRPVFLVLVNGHNSFADLAGKFDKFKNMEYYHSAIGFGPNLQHLYSFNNGHLSANAITGGLSFESFESYNHDHPDGDMEVSCILLNKQKYAQLKETLNYYVRNKEKTRYYFLDLVKLLFDKSDTPKLRFTSICSQFVDTILKSVDIDLNNKPNNLVAPDDLRVAEKNEKHFIVFKGTVKDYNIKKATRLVDKLSKDANNDYFKEVKKMKESKQDKEDKKD